MRPVKYSADETEPIDLGAKLVHKYPTPTREYDIARMVVNGRFPEDGKFVLNSVCDFFVYILKGCGTVYAGDNTYEVTVGDVVFVPKQNKYAVEGDFEYITIDVPAFNPEQSKEV